VGQVLDIDAAEAAAGATTPRPGDPKGSLARTILSPSGQRRDLASSTGAAGPASSAALELQEQGFYEVRSGSSVIVSASNVSLAESNLDPLDPKDLVLAVTGSGGDNQASGQDVLSDEAQELSQRVWWYLLFAGILLLIAETVLAGRLSRVAR
jgi:hypothetical protein